MIVNNTIVSTVAGAEAAFRILGRGTGQHDAQQRAAWAAAGVSLASASDSLSGLVSDYNVMGSLGAVRRHGEHPERRPWRSSSGQDAHSFTATTAQLFVNAAGGDYHLSSTSPAIDKGTSTNAPPTDAEGTRGPAGAGIRHRVRRVRHHRPRRHTSRCRTVKCDGRRHVHHHDHGVDRFELADTGYTGTVHFTSTDGQAVLPANYTFTAGRRRHAHLHASR